MATGSGTRRRRKQPQERCTILYVDDEDQARKYFERAFSRQFKVLMAASVAEAREILSGYGSEIAVAVVDERMPDEMGMSLLVELRQEWPDIVRVLTSGYTEFATAVRAINEAHVYAYIEKPWGVDFFDTVGEAAAHWQKTRAQPKRRRKPPDMVSEPKHEPEAGRAALATLAHVLEVWFPTAQEAVADFFEATGASDAVRADATREAPLGARVSRHVTEQLVKYSAVLEDAVHIGDMVQHAVLVGQELARQGLGSVQERVPRDLPLVRGNRDLLRVLFDTLMREMLRWQGNDASIRVSAAATPSLEAPAVQVLFRGGTRSWKPRWAALAETSEGGRGGHLRDLGADLLAAFFIVHHHHGRLLILREQPVGPGFELTLPVAPR